MANFLSALFGNSFPSTHKYENYLNQTKADYERFVEYTKSPVLKRYNELDAEINSVDFEKKVITLKTLKYKESSEKKLQTQYDTLRSSSDIKTYIKLTNSGKISRIAEIESSDLFTEYEKLKSFINSPEFYAAKAKKKFKKSEEYQILQEYKALSKNSEIKFFQKTIKSKDYKTAKSLENSDRLNSFYELEVTIMSDEFKNQTTFLKDKKRFYKSVEYQLIEEYKTLKKNEEIIWYLDKLEKKPFEEYKKWNLVFNDDFDKQNLDKSKWMTGYYWGHTLINENYSPQNELQFFTDNNINIIDSNAIITINEESITGKSWSTIDGFSNRNFDYTSGLLSTGQSFRMKYGRIEAKVSFKETYPIINALWLVGEKNTPQIDIFKTSNKKRNSIYCGIVDKNELFSKRIKGSFFGNKYHIFGMEWNEDEIIWTINGKVINKQKSDMLDDNMYLTFSTTLINHPKNSQTPSSMKIDWVRCYEKKK